MNKINCEFGGCKWLAEVSLYPSNSNHDFLAVHLCERHNAQMLRDLPAKQNIYQFASKFVTKSLG